MNNQDFGKFISMLRKEKGITQVELAEKLNVSDKAISRWENGKNYPDIEILENLGKELGVSINELIACRRFEDTRQAELETAKTAIIKSNSAKKFRNLAIAVISAFLAVIIVLLIPFPVVTNDKSSTTEYQALTYKFVKWNKTLAPDEVYRKNSFYFFAESKKSLDELWLHEEINSVHCDTYIDDIRGRGLNIGAEMPHIAYMDYKIVVFSGSCGIVIYDYDEEKIVNRLSGNYLSDLGYDLFWPTVDVDNGLIYVSADTLSDKDVLPLAYSMRDMTIKRIKSLPENGAGFQNSDTRIVDTDEKTRVEYERNLDCLISATCYDNHDFRAFLIADNDWDMESLQLVTEQNGKTQKIKIFK